MYVWGLTGKLVNSACAQVGTFTCVHARLQLVTKVSAKHSSGQVQCSNESRKGLKAMLVKSSDKNYASPAVV